MSCLALGNLNTACFVGELHDETLIDEEDASGRPVFLDDPGSDLEDDPEMTPNERKDLREYDEDLLEKNKDSKII